jgi:hypothetical protein
MRSSPALIYCAVTGLRYISPSEEQFLCWSQTPDSRPVKKAARKNALQICSFRDIDACADARICAGIKSGGTGENRVQANIDLAPAPPVLDQFG